MQSKINLEPMAGKVIVKPDNSDKQVGGIWLVTNARQSMGQIVAVYEGFEDPDTLAEVDPFLRMDDWVIFGQHSGVEVTVNREKYIVLREQEILCRVIDPEALNDAEAI